MECEKCGHATEDYGESQRNRDQYDTITGLYTENERLEEQFSIMGNAHRTLNEKVRRAVSENCVDCLRGWVEVQQREDEQ